MVLGFCFPSSFEMNVLEVFSYIKLYGGASRARAFECSPYLRKCGNLPIREFLVMRCTFARLPARRPSAPQAYQYEITQSTGMATQMQLEVILAGNRIASHVL